MDFGPTRRAATNIKRNEHNAILVVGLYQGWNVSKDEDLSTYEYCLLKLEKASPNH
jgi:hypothetical protein